MKIRTIFGLIIIIIVAGLFALGPYGCSSGGDGAADDTKGDSSGDVSGDEGDQSGSTWNAEDWEQYWDDQAAQGDQGGNEEGGGSEGGGSEGGGSEGGGSEGGGELPADEVMLAAAIINPNGAAVAADAEDKGPISRFATFSVTATVDGAPATQGMPRELSLLQGGALVDAVVATTDNVMELKPKRPLSHGTEYVLKAIMPDDAEDILGAFTTVVPNDVNGDGISDAVFAPQRGTVNVYFGQENLEISGDPSIRLLGEANDLFGYSLAVGDVTGDGYADIIVAAINKPYEGATKRGAVYVYFGAAEMPANLGLSNAQLYIQLAETGMTEFGMGVKVWESWEKRYLVIGAGSTDGKIYMVEIEPNQEPTREMVIGSDHQPSFTTSAGDDYELRMGSALAIGDVLADAGDHSFDEIIVGARGINETMASECTSGRVFVLQRQGDTFVSSGLVLYSRSGCFSNDNDFCGHSVATLADMDGDGLDEILAGARNKAVLFESSAMMPWKEIKKDDGNCFSSFTTVAGFMRSGVPWIAIGDFLNLTDSLLDTFPATAYADNPRTGSAQYVEESLGRAISPAGDLNADGKIDLIVCAANYAVWLYLTDGDAIVPISKVTGGTPNSLQAVAGERWR